MTSTTTAPQAWCTECLKWKPATDFDVDGRTKGGKARKRCRTCQRKVDRERVRACVEKRGLKACPSGRPHCFNPRCPQEGRFVLVDGRRACARCLKAIVKERKSE